MKIKDGVLSCRYEAASGGRRGDFEAAGEDVMGTFLKFEAGVPLGVQRVPQNGNSDVYIPLLFKRSEAAHEKRTKTPTTFLSR
jgi:hypothetical protein